MEIHLTENKTCTDAIEIDSGISHFSRLTTCKSHVLDSSLSMRGRPDRSSRPDVLFWGLTPVSGMQHSSVTLPQRMGCHSQSMDDIRLCISPLGTEILCQNIAWKMIFLPVKNVTGKNTLFCFNLTTYKLEHLRWSVTTGNPSST